MARLAIQILNVSDAVKQELEHIEKQLDSIHGKKDKIDFIKSYIQDKEHIHLIRATLIKDNHLDFIPPKETIDNNSVKKAELACSNAIDEAGGVIQFYKERYKAPSEYSKDFPHKMHLTALPSLEILRFLIDLMDDNHTHDDNISESKQGRHLSKRSSKLELKNHNSDSIQDYFRRARDKKYITYNDAEWDKFINDDGKITVIAKYQYQFIINFFKYLELENAIHQVRDWAKRIIDCCNYRDDNKPIQEFDIDQLNKRRSNNTPIEESYKELFDGIFHKK